MTTTYTNWEAVWEDVGFLDMWDSTTTADAAVVVRYGQQPDLEPLRPAIDLREYDLSTGKERQRPPAPALPEFEPPAPPLAGLAVSSTEGLSSAQLTRLKHLAAVEPAPVPEVAAPAEPNKTRLRLVLLLTA
jgi:hypothetical protein